MNFTRQQRNGILVLILLIVMMALLPYGLEYFGAKESFSLSDYSNLERQLEQFFKEDSLKKLEKVAKIEEERQAKIHSCNPNKASKQELVGIGLSPYQAQQIIKYRRAGGRFRSLSDLKKIYSINNKDYKKVQPYLFIPKPKKKAPKKNKKKKIIRKENYSEKAEDVSLNISLNTCEREELENIRGIGCVLSERIVKYRKKLGGFVSIQQLNEVYGLDSLLVRNIEKHLLIDSLKIQKIRLNFVSLKDLIGHPYLTYKEAKTILKERSKNGSFRSYKDLKERVTLSNGLKIRPYIEF